ncbi:MAG: cob(I)yrinic acid a,c-diamide adenosyltransferase [Flavobacteriales bacterium]|jgi:cob(I)alamin adenosyltransferase|nr:cob(I)yrinic acid a,c-diamide adenosyltransferase [Flavobacteriales bacterium]
MKVYTKKGDKGKTQLLGGSMVDKDHAKLECYGTIDELNSFIGNVYDQELNSFHKEILLKIQNQLFNLGSIISFDGEKNKIKLPNIKIENIKMLEKAIDKMEENLPKLRSFILPSGHPTASKCHIARTVCRRAERNLVTLSKTTKIDMLHLQYLNRLSDYLFILSRAILKDNGDTEIEWQKD